MTPDPLCPHCRGSGVSRMQRITLHGYKRLPCYCTLPAFMAGKVVHEERHGDADGGYDCLWYCQPPPDDEIGYVVTAEKWTDDFTVRHIYGWARADGWWSVSRSFQ